MKKRFFISLLLLVLCCSPFVNYAQSETSDSADTEETPDEIIINGKHYKAVEDDSVVKVERKPKHLKPVDSIFVKNNGKFQYYNNWLVFGGGVQQNVTYKRDLGFAGAVDYNFHIKRNYFQVGALLSGPQFSHYNNYELRGGYVRRFEDGDFHFAAALGVSYSVGYQLVPIDSVTNTTRSYYKPGLYLQGEVVKKITYDVGIGACLFADWNQEQSMIGLRFVLYFSTAYTGKKYKTAKDYE